MKTQLFGNSEQLLLMKKYNTAEKKAKKAETKKKRVHRLSLKRLYGKKPLLSNKNTFKKLFCQGKFRERCIK